jgi:hypothetical protein
MLRWGSSEPAPSPGALAPAMRACGHDLAVVGSRSLCARRPSPRTTACGEPGAPTTRSSRPTTSTPSTSRCPTICTRSGRSPRSRPASTCCASARCRPTPPPPAAWPPPRPRTAGCSWKRLPTWFHPRTEAALDLLRTGGLGEVRSRAGRLGVRLRDPRQLPAQDRSTAAGRCSTSASHGVAVPRWVAGGEPDGSRGPARWSTGVDGTTSALLPSPNGTGRHRARLLRRRRPRGARGRRHRRLCCTLPDAFTPRRDEAVLLRDGEVVGTWHADAYEAADRRLRRGRRPALWARPAGRRRRRHRRGARPHPHRVARSRAALGCRATGPAPSARSEHGIRSSCSTASPRTRGLRGALPRHPPARWLDEWPGVRGRSSAARILRHPARRRAPYTSSDRPHGSPTDALGRAMQSEARRREQGRHGDVPALRAERRDAARPTTLAPTRPRAARPGVHAVPRGSPQCRAG